MKQYYSISEVADLLSVSKETLRRWDRSGKLSAVREPMSNYRVYKQEQLKIFDSLDFLFNPTEKKSGEIPTRDFHAIELFAGAGGLAIGLEKAGVKCLALNEIDHWACETLRHNRPDWNVIEADIRNVSFKELGEVDIVTGGFPCQAFSYAGKRLGLSDARGTLFYEFARIVQETNPAICVGENVRGLLNHDNGRTIRGMISILDEIGYNVITPRIFKTIFYKVPQKRERMLIVGIRKDLKIDQFEFPVPYKKVYTLKDALKKGELYNCDVPQSPGSKYPKTKKDVLDLIPPGGYWRDLPLGLQKEYMGGSFHLSGGKTGMARRMSWSEPSLTLTCSPAQKQTERCHPEETRPFTIREYARIQTFPDDWVFMGSVSQQYKQIGNAVPVNFAKEVGLEIVNFLNKIYPKVN